MRCKNEKMKVEKEKEWIKEGLEKVIMIKEGLGRFVWIKEGLGRFVRIKEGLGRFVKIKEGLGRFVKIKEGLGRFLRIKEGLGRFVRIKEGLGRFIKINFCTHAHPFLHPPTHSPPTHPSIRRFPKRIYLPLPDKQTRAQLLSRLFATQNNNLNNNDIIQVARLNFWVFH